MLVNTEIIKNNVVLLENESKYYKNKTSSFSSFIDDNNKNLSNYIRNINSIYINISNNLESISNYISDYINDLESVENLICGKQSYIKSSEVSSVVSKTKNSIKKHIIDDSSIFEITNYSNSSSGVSNSKVEENANNKERYSNIISLVKRAISENKDVNEILKMYSIVDIRNAMMLFPGVITLDMLNNSFKKEEDNPFDDIENPYEDEVITEVKLSDLKTLIYNSKYLNQDEKDFLFNENLLSKVALLYNIEAEYGNFANNAIRRHSDIQIVSYNKEEMPGTSGFYSGYENINQLYIADYNNELIYENSKEKQAKTLAHEYIHLLQVFFVQRFISEGCAEIMTHEFYMESAFVKLNKDENGILYSYIPIIKYLKILMEIIGSDIIFEVNFSKAGKYDLERVLNELLDENDYKDFQQIFNFSDSLSYFGLDYKRLEELLSKMYKKRYGTDMYDNGLINAILNNRPYSRVYFNDELREKQKDFYYEVVSKNTYSVQEAYKLGYLDIFVIQSFMVSEEEYNSYNGEKFIDIVSLQDNVSIYEKNNNKYVKVIDSSGEKIISVDEAISKDFVRIDYYIKSTKTENDIENDLKTLNNDELKKYYGFYPKEGFNAIYNRKDNTVYREELKKVEIESLPKIDLLDICDDVD